MNPEAMHPYIDAAYSASEGLSRAPGVVHELFDEFCHSNRVDVAGMNAQQRASFLVLIETMGQNLARRRLLKLLADHIEVDVYGGVDNISEFEGKDVNFHGDTDYDTVLKATDASEAVVNITPKYAHGATERVWDSLSRGALVLSTKTTQLTEFATGGGVQFIDFELSDDELSQSLEQMVRGDTLSSQRANFESFASGYTTTLSRVDLLQEYFSN